MTANNLLDALALPSQSFVKQRVPKKNLLEMAANTTADKKAINDGVEELIWEASLKPETVGVPAYQDAERKYEEIAVLTLTLRENAPPARLRELLHRSILYPLLLITTSPTGLAISLCEFRHSLGETDKIVLDGPPQHADLPDDPLGERFRQSLAITRLPHSDLRQLYLGWLDQLASLEAARLLNRWPEEGDAARRREALRSIRQFDIRIAEIRRQAENEKQLPKLVELNLELQKLRKDRTLWLKHLE